MIVKITFNLDTYLDNQPRLDALLKAYNFVNPTHGYDKRITDRSVETKTFDAVIGLAILGDDITTVTAAVKDCPGTVISIEV